LTQIFIGYDRQDCTDKPDDEYMKCAWSQTVKDTPSSSVELEETVDNRPRYEVTKNISRFMRQQTSFSETANDTLSQCIEEAKTKFQAIKSGAKRPAS
jgi:hypothetical protein